MWLVRIAFLLGMVVLIGCGPGSTTEGPDAVSDSMVQSIKSALQDVAETGEMGEAFGEARGMVAELKETNPEIGNKLSADLEAMENLSSPDEIKAKAKEIAEGL